MLANLAYPSDQAQHSTTIRLVLAGIASPSGEDRQPQEALPPVADRRKSPRFKVGNELLCVSDDYAGQILDISPTGMAFALVKFRLHATNAAPMHQPCQSERLNILHAGPLSFFIMKNLQVNEWHDRSTGLLYPGNAALVNYRRGVGFAVPLTAKEFAALQPYLAAA